MHRRRGLRLAARANATAHRLSGPAAASAASPRRSRALQENTVHYYQRPDADYIELDPNATSLGGHAGSVSVRQDRRREACASASIVGYKTPGLRHQRPRLPAPRRRAHHEQLGAVARLRCRASTCARATVNFNQWAGWNFGGDRLFSGGNVNMHWRLQNNWRAGFGVNVNAAACAIAPRAAGRACCGNPTLGASGTTSTSTIAARCSPATTASSAATAGHRCARHQPEASTGGRRRRCASSSGSATAATRRRAVGGERRRRSTAPTHYVFGRLEQRTVAMTAAAQLHDDAEPVVPELRGAVRLGRRTTTTYKELVDGRAAGLRRPLRARTPTPATPTSTIRSFRTTNVLRWEYKPGSALFVVWQQGRQERSRGSTASSTSAATSAACSRRRHATRSW